MFLVDLNHSWIEFELYSPPHCTLFITLNFCESFATFVVKFHTHVILQALSLSLWNESIELVRHIFTSAVIAEVRTTHSKWPFR